MHFEWDVQMRMAFVEPTVISNAASGGLAREIVLS